MDSDYPGAPDPGETPFDPYLVLNFLWRRRFIIVPAVLVALIPAIYRPLSLPSVFEATAKIMIQQTPEVMELGPDIMSDPGRGAASAMMELARSDAVLSRVGAQLPATPKSEPGLLHRVASYLGLPGAAPELTPQQELQRRTEGIRRSLTLKSTGGGTVLLVSASARSPLLATFLANATADAFVQYKSDQREAASKRAVTWLSQQIYELRTQIERQEKARASLLLQHGDLSSDSNGEGSGFRARLVSELQTTHIELMAAEEHLAALAPPPQRRTTGAKASEQIGLLREQYATASSALETARTNYTPAHPELRRLKEVVSGLEARLGTDFLPDPLGVAEEKEHEYRALQSERFRLEARVHVLEKALDELSATAGEGSETRIEYKRLERELAIGQTLFEILIRRRNETLLSAVTEHHVAKILDYAIPPVDPVGPNRRKLMILGMAGAVLFGLGVGLLREVLDRGVRDPEKVARILGVPLLGLIPKVPSDQRAEHQSAGSHASLASESYINLRTALAFSSRNSDLSPLVVTSVVAGEGKTTVSSNLAASFARAGRSVLLVEADLRLPRLHEVFSVPISPGLSEVLQGKVRLEEAIRDQIAGDFHLLTSGAIPDRPTELLSSSEFTALLAEMQAKYDMVLLDSPVLLAVSDALLLAAKAKATLLVNWPGKVNSKALERTRSQLESAQARVVGVVLNRAESGDRYLYPSYFMSPYLDKSRKADTAGGH